MTPEDQIKQLVRDVLNEDGPEIARRKAVETRRADFQRFLEKLSPPVESSASVVDISNGPVRFEETILPVQHVFFNDPAPNPVPAVPTSGSTVRTRICLEDGTVAVVNVVVQ